MSFRVDPLALNGYAALVARARDDAHQCKSYFDGTVTDFAVGGDGGLFNILSYEHAGVKAKIADMVDQLATLLATSRNELAQAATDYRTTDEDSAARIDSTYSEVARPQPRDR